MKEVKVSEITAKRTCEDEKNEEKIKPKKCRRWKSEPDAELKKLKRV